MSVRVAAPTQPAGSAAYYAAADVEATGAQRPTGWPWARRTVVQYRITFYEWAGDSDTSTCWVADEAAARRRAQARMKRANDRWDRLLRRPGGCDCGHCGFCRP